MGSAVLTNPVATQVDGNNATKNLNTTLHLGMRTGGVGTSYALIYFSRPFPLGANILSARIVYYMTAMPEDEDHTITWQRLNQSFSASKVTYNTRPTSLISGTKAETRSGVYPAGEEWEVDIADWMQTIANGGANYGFRVSYNQPLRHSIYSELYTDPALRPRLEVVWSDAPQTPSGLSPAGGRAVGENKPVVRANFLDVSGATALQAINVQINATDVWTSPSFDSGTVLTSVPELDLAGTAFGGVSDGSTVYWRVRFQDAAGIWSPWSASTSFKYDAKGSLALDNPPSGTPTVEDTTPPISWTFSGETQAAYQVQIKHTVNGVDVIDWDTGKITSTDDTITVPSGKINEPTNTTYTITVRVWDNKQREATAGMPIYTEVVREFTFVPGATTGTTSLSAVPDVTGVPKVVLTWTAATFPDRFNILRNGKIIAAALDPDDTFVSGTTHTWTDNTPHPNRSLTYSVQRVVNDVASATNDSESITVRSKGIWLKEPVSGLELFISGREDRPFTLNEQGTVLQAIAPNSVPLAINQSLGGLEGTIQGTLVNYGGLTAQEWRDRYYQLRNMRVKKFYLTTGDYAFQVVCQEFTYQQRTIPTPAFEVSFKFYQQDHLTNPLDG